MNRDHRLTRQVEDYISFKQSLGYQITIESAELRRFAKFAKDKCHEGSLTIELALDWASEKAHYSQWYKARRLETVHSFAKYAFAVDVETQVPRTGVFGKCHGRVTPYIYSNDEVLLLMEKANELLSPDGLRAKATNIALGLLWSTGIRVSELCRLIRTDINFNKMEIYIRDTKFHKYRNIPVQSTVINALKDYANYRDSLYPNSSDPHFFLATGGKMLSLRNLEYSFTVIRASLLSEGKKSWDNRPPRLYDLRHTFACNTIIRWFKEGEDINHHIYLLSTYLGHVKPNDTYWYLTGTPELLTIATKQFENYTHGLEMEVIYAKE
ncbi:tyrosine-type recombinase/integrase [Bacillus sp. DJP31]|uniref:tyrosine-type recombinase/integrase n=1 Tax=Bacillus sp. DJP31 TaxID=3409789 RepID=UPI003BB57E31